MRGSGTIETICKNADKNIGVRCWAKLDVGVWTCFSWQFCRCWSLKPAVLIRKKMHQFELLHFFCQFVANSFTLKLPVKKTVLALAAGQNAWYERSTLPIANGDNWLVFGLVHVAASWCVMHLFHVYLVYFSMRIVRQIWDCRPQESFFAACLANGTISGLKQTQLSQTWSASKFPVRSGRNPQRQW